MPGLYEDFVSQVGVPITQTSFFLGAREIKTYERGELYVVDRNHIVAAIARFLNENFLDSGRLTLHYSHKVGVRAPP